MDGATSKGTTTEAASILLRANGFLYRCNNDTDYSMLYMEGAVAGLTGYPAADFLGPLRRSYVGITHADDKEMVVARVDAALASRTTWSLEYRLCRADGADQWVHEFGGGVFDGAGRLLYLEGIVLDHSVRRAEELAAGAMQAELADKCRILLQDTGPVLDVLRLLRILAINARIEAGRVGMAGAGFAVVAAEIGRLADETSARAHHIAEVTRDLQLLLNGG